MNRYQTLFGKHTPMLLQSLIANHTTTTTTTMSLSYYHSGICPLLPLLLRLNYTTWLSNFPGPSLTVVDSPLWQPCVLVSSARTQRFSCLHMCKARTCACLIVDSIIPLSERWEFTTLHDADIASSHWSIKSTRVRMFANPIIHDECNTKMSSAA